jgi:hypothetical protein
MKTDENKMLARIHLCFVQSQYGSFWANIGQTIRLSSIVGNFKVKQGPCIPDPTTESGRIYGRYYFPFWGSTESSFLEIVVCDDFSLVN